MPIRDSIAIVLARDSRYTIQAYGFVLEALEHTKKLRNRARKRARARRGRTTTIRHHVTGKELCDGARDLALRHYGLLAITVLAQWGIRSTSDMGSIVYNLIAAGDLEQAPEDSPADFENLFDFEEAFLRDDIFEFDDID